MKIMKKEYLKPTMAIYVLDNHCILAGSFGEAETGNEGTGEGVVDGGEL